MSTDRPEQVAWIASMLSLLRADVAHHTERAAHRFLVATGQPPTGFTITMEQQPGQAWRAVVHVQGVHDGKAR